MESTFLPMQNPPACYSRGIFFTAFLNELELESQTNGEAVHIATLDTRVADGEGNRRCACAEVVAQFEGVGERSVVFLTELFEVAWKAYPCARAVEELLVQVAC